MSSFHVAEHVIDAAHIREYARATAEDQDAALKLHVKRYTPKDNPSPRKGDVTIIGGHANGFPKELYEPLWHHLHQQLAKQGLRIRDVWIADCAWQGQSGVLNHSQGLLGNDPSWYDYSRDIIHMINTFRMPRPLVAIGHSFGANAIAHAASLHPRLFHSMILLDAVIKRAPSRKGEGPAAASTQRRDVWPSRQKAAESFRKSPYFRSWDPRVSELWIEHGLQDRRGTHPPADSDADDGVGAAQVTLTTSKHQEVFTYVRPSWPAFDAEGNNVVDADWIKDMDTPVSSPSSTQQDFKGARYPFYRPEPVLTFQSLPLLRPSVLFINGASSTVVTPEEATDRAATTGTARSASGGLAARRVRNVTHPHHGHLIPFEDPLFCAQEAAAFLTPELAIWAAHESEYDDWAKQPLAQKTTISQDWKLHLGIHDAKAKM